MRYGIEFLTNGQWNEETFRFSSLARGTAACTYFEKRGYTVRVVTIDDATDWIPMSYKTADYLFTDEACTGETPCTQ